MPPGDKRQREASPTFRLERAEAAAATATAELRAAHALLELERIGRSYIRGDDRPKLLQAAQRARRAGLSQRQMAVASGISHETIRKLLRGR
jgi:hypothetical protein